MTKKKNKSHHKFSHIVGFEPGAIVSLSLGRTMIADMLILVPTPKNASWTWVHSRRSVSIGIRSVALLRQRNSVGVCCIKKLELHAREKSLRGLLAQMIFWSSKYFKKIKTSSIYFFKINSRPKYLFWGKKINNDSKYLFWELVAGKH